MKIYIPTLLAVLIIAGCDTVPSEPVPTRPTPPTLGTGHQSGGNNPPQTPSDTSSGEIEISLPPTLSGSDTQIDNSLRQIDVMIGH